MFILRRSSTVLPGDLAIHAPLQSRDRPFIAWRDRLSSFLWFGRSVRTQIVIVFVIISAVAATIAGGVTIYKAGKETRIEIAASMTLAELMVSEAVQLIQQGIPAEPFLNTLPQRLRFVRHVRIGIRDGLSTASDGATNRIEPPRAPDRVAAPAWFARMIDPPIERHEVPVIVNGTTIATVDVVSEPQDEIEEVWENTVALASIAVITVFAVIGILYLVLGRVLDPLTALGNGLLGLEHRDYKLRLARPRVLEFAAIADHFNALASALDDARAENLALNRRLITAQDDERRRTALELHDEVGPSLFGLKANAASIAKAAGEIPRPAAAAIAERVRDLTTIIGHLQEINRNILNRLRPMALGHVPLREILVELVRERARQYPEITFTHAFDGIKDGYGDTVDLTVYRCVQESLTNAIRHASATAIDVRVADVCGAGRQGEGGMRLELAVRDNGTGMSANLHQGFGLRGMRERVQALGGDFAIDTGGPGCGTRIGIVISLSEQPALRGKSPEQAIASSRSP